MASERFREHGADFSASIYEDLVSAGAFVFGDDGRRRIDYRTHRIVTCPDLLPLLAASKVRIVGAIERVGDASVLFEDGTQETPDALVFCTGYSPALPALPEDRGERLIGNMRDAHIPGLWFIGLTPIWGSAATIARLQSSVMARTIAGEVDTDTFGRMAAQAPAYASVGEIYGPGLELVEFNSYARFLRQLDQSLADRARAGKLEPAALSA
jgi:hypothetical protein